LKKGKEIILKRINIVLISRGIKLVEVFECYLLACNQRLIDCWIILGGGVDGDVVYVLSND